MEVQREDAEGLVPVAQARELEAPHDARDGGHLLRAGEELAQQHEADEADGRRPCVDDVVAGDGGVFGLDDALVTVGDRERIPREDLMLEQVGGF
jgi:hypothetical protein